MAAGADGTTGWAAVVMERQCTLPEADDVLAKVVIRGQEIVRGTRVRTSQTCGPHPSAC
nr:hypothetical protein StreXyl84_01160 [Streptomyces sp. Xyl84]